MIFRLQAQGAGVREGEGLYDRTDKPYAYPPASEANEYFRMHGPWMYCIISRVRVVRHDGQGGHESRENETRPDQSQQELSFRSWYAVTDGTSYYLEPTVPVRLCL